MTYLSNLEISRSFYIGVFILVLFISIIFTLCIYYCVRYKKKYYFDASGRKFIVSTGEESNLINKLMEIIQFDNKKDLEEEVISKSIGILHLKNENNQNLLHQCAFNGARDCMFYLIKFGLINPNEKDKFGEVPLFYIIKHHSENTRKNKEMFLWLSNVTNLSAQSSDGYLLTEMFNDWQKYVFEKYVKKSFMKKYEIETENP